ncbi:MAG: hypothetical protein KTR31_01940 [Myxococcales bacterium]|nr:hypothetical protein [Myxococcales bacterium]
MLMLATLALASGDAREDCPPGTYEDCRIHSWTTLQWIWDPDLQVSVPVFTTHTHEICTCEDLEGPPVSSDPGNPDDEDGGDEDGDPVPGPGDL